MQLGSVADTITAFTAIGALLAAIVGSKHASRLLAVEAKRDESSAELEPRTPPTQVSAWVASRIVEEQAKAHGTVVEFLESSDL